MQIVKSINTGSVLLKTISIQAILAKVGMHDEVTIFGKARIVNVLGIYVCSFAE